MKQLFIILFVVSLLKVYLNERQHNRINVSSTKLTNELTYLKDILPIIKLRCAMCHNSGTPDRNWMDYQTTYKKRDSIKLRLENRSMPIGITMLDSERKKMIDWVNQGAKK